MGETLIAGELSRPNRGIYVKKLVGCQLNDVRTAVKKQKKDTTKDGLGTLMAVEDGFILSTDQCR